MWQYCVLLVAFLSSWAQEMCPRAQLAPQGSFVNFQVCQIPPVPVKQVLFAPAGARCPILTLAWVVSFAQLVPIAQLLCLLQELAQLALSAAAKACLQSCSVGRVNLVFSAVALG